MPRHATYGNSFRMKERFVSVLHIGDGTVVGNRQILDPFGLIGLLTGSGGLRPPRICCPRLRYSGRPHTPFEH